MKPLDPQLMELFNQVKASLSDEGSELNAAAATLLLANELQGVKSELTRIANVLETNAENMGEVAQSDVASTMLALLTALKATQGGSVT